MSNHIQGQCPHCGSRSPQALLPTVAPAVAEYEAGELLPLSTAVHHTQQHLVCSACENSWEAAIVPKSQMERLLAAVTNLDDARRQIAMMRLIMSKDQIARAEKSREDVIQFRKAA